MYWPWNIYGKTLPLTSSGRSTNDVALLSEILTPLLAAHWHQKHLRAAIFERVLKRIISFISLVWIFSPSPVQGTRLSKNVGIQSVSETVSHHFSLHPTLFLQVSFCLLYKKGLASFLFFSNPSRGEEGLTQTCVAVILWGPTTIESREWKWKSLRNTFLHRDLMTTLLALEKYSCKLYCTLLFLIRIWYFGFRLKTS